MCTFADADPVLPPTFRLAPFHPGDVAFSRRLPGHLFLFVDVGVDVGVGVGSGGCVEDGTGGRGGIGGGIRVGGGRSGVGIAVSGGGGVGVGGGRVVGDQVTERGGGGVVGDGVGVDGSAECGTVCSLNGRFEAGKAVSELAHSRARRLVERERGELNARAANDDPEIVEKTHAARAVLVLVHNESCVRLVTRVARV